MVPYEAEFHQKRIRLLEQALQEYGETFICVDSAADLNLLARLTFFHAHRAVTVLSGYLDGGARILDVGIGLGFSFHLIAYHYPSAIGIDIDQKASMVAKSTLKRDGSPGIVMAGDGSELPFPDDVFDGVICNTVIEHVADPHFLLRELCRVLKPDGVLYLTAPNRLWPVESHFRLPFLSFLPKRWANKYIEVMGRSGRYDDISPPTYGELQRFARPFFSISDRTLEVVRDYELYGTDKDRGPLIVPVGKMLGWLDRRDWLPGRLVASALRWLILRLAPGWIWVCVPIKGP